MNFWFCVSSLSFSTAIEQVISPTIPRESSIMVWIKIIQTISQLFFTQVIIQLIVRPNTTLFQSNFGLKILKSCLFIRTNKFGYYWSNRFPSSNNTAWNPFDFDHYFYLCKTSFGKSKTLFCFCYYPFRLQKREDYNSFCFLRLSLFRVHCFVGHAFLCL